MDKSGRNLFVKAMIVLPVMWIVLTLFNNISFLTSTLLGIVLLFVAYMIGDLGILPRSGNITATISDFILSYLVIWIGLLLLGYNDVAGEAFATSLLLAVGEYFYHRWLLNDEATDYSAS